jgi:hypothetical protein
VRPQRSQREVLELLVVVGIERTGAHQLRPQAHRGLGTPQVLLRLVGGETRGAGHRSLEERA